MPFGHILAQDTAVGTLTRALRAGRVHHAYRFEGPDGVGKELCAFALAQALVCTGGDPLGCGACHACKRAVTLSDERPHRPLHPDVTLLERGLYPPEAIGRSRPELSELSVDQVRKIVLAHAAFAPHEGRARVYIVRRAEELSIGAANALLKTLEEPHAGTYFILLTARGERLLDTIRSRTLPLRFAPLPDAVIRGILTARGVPDERQALANEHAPPRPSAAGQHCDPEATASRDELVAAVLAALSARDLTPAIAIAEARDKGKETLKGDLRALGAALARSARATIAASPREAALAARRYDAVARAIEGLERNASPSLSMIALVAEMRDAVP